MRRVERLDVCADGDLAIDRGGSIVVNDEETSTSSFMTKKRRRSGSRSPSMQTSSKFRRRFAVWWRVSSWDSDWLPYSKLTTKTSRLSVNSFHTFMHREASISQAAHLSLVMEHWEHARTTRQESPFWQQSPHTTLVSASPLAGCGTSKGLTDRLVQQPPRKIY